MDQETKALIEQAYADGLVKARWKYRQAWLDGVNAAGMEIMSMDQAEFTLEFLREKTKCLRHGLAVAQRGLLLLTQAGGVDGNEHLQDMDSVRNHAANCLALIQEALAAFFERSRRATR